VSKKPLFRRSEFVVAPISEIWIHPNGEKFQLAWEVHFDGRHLPIFEHIYPVSPECEDIHADCHSATDCATSAGFNRRVGDAITNLKASESAIVEDQDVTKKSPRPRTKSGQYLAKALPICLESMVPSLEGCFSAGAVEADPKLRREISHKQLSLIVLEVTPLCTYKQNVEKCTCQVSALIRTL
jgi:hypothetical protein